MTNTYEKEQNEIITKVHQMQEPLRGKGGVWNGFRGDSTVRILVSYLAKYILNNKIDLGYWIEGVPYQYDILILDKNAIFTNYGNTYDINQVKCVIEIKAGGLFFPAKSFKEDIQNYFKKIQPGKVPLIYLTIWENKSNTERTYNFINRENIYILEIGKNTNKGEWGRFIEKIKELCK